MLFLFALILAFGFTYLCRKILKRQPVICYIAAGILSVSMVCIDFKGLPFWFNTYIIGLFSRGTFATALWCVVMWTGAFPNGSKAIKTFMPIRGEISILAALLTLGHNIGYGKTYFVLLFTDIEKMSINQILASILTLFMLAIMIPLTILSFPKIRRKINPKRWKRIQRFAYLFYGMLYLHVMILCMPLAQAGREGYLLRVMIYSLVFISYGVCRIRKWAIKRNTLLERKVLNAACTGAFTILIGLAAVLAKPSKTQANKELEDTIDKWNLQKVWAAGEKESGKTETVEKENGSEVMIEAETAGFNKEENKHYTDGIYKTSAFGYDGEVEITITIQDNQITDMDGITYEGDNWYYETAKKQIFPQILSEQSYEIDTVSGATYSSKAILEAVRQALEEAEYK